MTDYREINALQKAPGRARDLARYLLQIPDIEWTDWERDFLEGKSKQEDNLSTRQAEKLVELRDASVWYERVERFSLRLLIENCSRSSHLFDERDQEFITKLYSSGMRRLRRRDAARLLRCARANGEIEPYMGWTLDPPKLLDAA